MRTKVRWCRGNIVTSRQSFYRHSLHTFDHFQPVPSLTFWGIHSPHSTASQGLSAPRVNLWPHQLGTMSTQGQSGSPAGVSLGGRGPAGVGWHRRGRRAGDLGRPGLVGGGFPRTGTHTGRPSTGTRVHVGAHPRQAHLRQGAALKESPGALRRNPHSEDRGLLAQLGPQGHPPQDLPRRGVFVRLSHACDYKTKSHRRKPPRLLGDQQHQLAGLPPTGCWTTRAQLRARDFHPPALPGAGPPANVPTPHPELC